ncbi:MAG: pyruvate dehydrogenase [Deltaproteobacteria bacterium]|nr:pyruvate dehydrogenase [Deltaproteobacteria bacterium]
MRSMTFDQAIEDALAYAMAKDSRIFIMGEDVHLLRVNLFARFGKDRVRSAPISESAFLGAAVTAAMAGCRPVVEIMMIDFITVAIDALVNHAAKIDAFTDGKWQAPLVVRTSCGGGYGDGGQHEQSLWGWLAHIPGLSVVVPSNPADAGGLMLSAIADDNPVIFMEHKLLAGYWLDYLGSGGRANVSFDIPKDGACGMTPDIWEPVPIGKARIVRKGGDLTIISVGVGVHRSIAAAAMLEKKGISSTVIDLRSVFPLDEACICDSVKETQNLIVVDEDYKRFGLSGEIAAILLENRIRFNFKRVCTDTTIPYARELEDRALPGVDRIMKTAERLMAEKHLEG